MKILILVTALMTVLFSVLSYFDKPPLSVRFDEPSEESVKRHANLSFHLLLTLIFAMFTLVASIASLVGSK